MAALTLTSAAGRSMPRRPLSPTARKMVREINAAIDAARAAATPAVQEEFRETLPADAELQVVEEVDESGEPRGILAIASDDHPEAD